MLWIAAFLFAMCSGATVPGTGLEMVAHQSMFDKINKIVPDIINQILPEIPIPPISGDIDLPEPFHDATWNVTNLKIPSLKFNNSATLIQEDGVAIIGVGGSVKALADYQWKTHGIIRGSDHGTVDIVLKGVGLNFLLKIGEKKGRPTISTPGPPYVSLTIQSIELTFHGKVASVYNALAKELAGPIKVAINTASAPAITKSINGQLEHELAKLRVLVPWDNVLMNFAMTGPPLYGKDSSNERWLSFGLQGTWEDRKDPQPCPYKTQPMPSSPQTSKEFEVYGGEYVLNCAGLVYYKMDLLNLTLTPAALPAADRGLLNTSTYKDILPNLFKTYPNEAMMAFVKASKAPLFQATSKGLTAMVHTNIAFSCKKGATYEPAFSIFFSTNVSLDLTAKSEAKKGAFVSANVTAMACSVLLDKSEIGPIPAVSLDALVKATCQAAPDIIDSTIFKQPLPLPAIDGFSLGQPIVAWGNGYAGLSADILYTK